MIESIIRAGDAEQLDKSKDDLNAAGIKDGQALVESGQINAHEWYVNIRRVQEFLTGVEKGLSDQVKVEIGNNGEYIKIGRAKIDVSNTGDRLNYEQDPVCADLMSQLKARQTLVKIATKGGARVADPIHGDEVAAVGIKVFGKETIKVQL